VGIKGIQQTSLNPLGSRDLIALAKNYRQIIMIDQEIRKDKHKFDRQNSRKKLDDQKQIVDKLRGLKQLIRLPIK
jgi:3-methyladenine DNA glycosylase AlkC